MALAFLVLAAPAPALTPAQLRELRPCCGYDRNSSCVMQAPHWECPAACGACGGPGWMPAEWHTDAASADLLPAAPREPGATISNGYVGAWLPLSLPGSAGPPVIGVEHVHGVFAASATGQDPMPTGARKVHRPSFPSFTITARIADITSQVQVRRGGALALIAANATPPAVATAAALDLRRHAYRVAYRARAGAGRCTSATFAHRKRKHIVAAVFDCSNDGASGAGAGAPGGPAPGGPMTVRIVQDRCDGASAPQLCANASAGELRVTAVSSGIAGVECYRAAVQWAEVADAARARPPVVGHCYEAVPAGGRTVEVAAGERRVVALLSSRATSLDRDERSGALLPASRDPVRAALAALLEARHRTGAQLWEEHAEAAARVSGGAGIEVAGNATLARLVNASLYALNGVQREGNFYSSSPGGIVSNGYAGHTFWDVETWQWPVWLALWPRAARDTLAYRVARLDAARANAATPQQRIDVTRSYAAGGLAARYPWESACVGLEQDAGTTEDHLQGDVALAFAQYFAATGDVGWLKGAGFPVLAGVAHYYCALAERDGRTAGGAPAYTIRRTQGPDEYHNNVTDSVYGNVVARLALRTAAGMAPLAGAPPNATWAAVASGLRVLYDPALDWHPEFAGYNRSAPNLANYTDCNGCDSMVKQGDAVLLHYPLGLPMRRSTLLHDLRAYAPRTDPYGPAMTWGAFALAFKDAGLHADAAAYFEKGHALNNRGPFFAWHEGLPIDCAGGREPCDHQGCPNFLTGAGGFLQSVINGYAGSKRGAARGGR
eukprot:g1773.t1